MSGRTEIEEAELCAMVAMLLKKGTVQQKSTVTLTLMHAASAPRCIDLPQSARLTFLQLP